MADPTPEPPHPILALLTEAIDEALDGDRTVERRNALVGAYTAAVHGALETLYHRTADQRELDMLVERPACPHCGADLGHAP